jgi:predicted nucleotide-binding protein (sugar kinase/HSP70/actin superfamily)
MASMRLCCRAPTDPNLSRARAAIAEDVCLPALMTTEDILCRAAAPDFDPASEAFFMAASDGPCRFGMYSILQRRLLDRLGLPQTDIASMGFRSRDGGLGTLFALTAWDALVAGDLLHRMLCRTRPYEIEAGAADTVYQRYLQELIALIPALKARMTDGVHPVLSYLDTGYLEPVEILLPPGAGGVSARPEARRAAPHGGRGRGVLRAAA